ncbi:capsular polysaccharide biosynthesis protein [Roseibium hamelinense]|uniref:Capsular polysaccharide biosynthesis protein n=1 Tax=Roseibium hamelinense TaxID=150831 RepID=A0A562T7U3_9HYPH|nr:hypothetical protein [Roseibium hamelinense]MTI42991.1 hypothetical protein [Roseibium hamelinense]TWI89602.1 capsular polysaccharide biosynthesis protein [Roseibium hamelinense]
MAQAFPRLQRLYTADVTLDAVRAKIERMTGARFVSSAPGKADVIACGPADAALEKAIKLSGGKKPVLVVLPGLFPCASKTYPSSITAIFLPPVARQGEPGSALDALVNAFLAETAPEPPETATPFLDRVRDGHRVHRFSAAEVAGDEADKASRSFMEEPSSGAISDPFWQKILAAEPDKARLAIRCERLLTELTTWFEPYSGSAITADEALDIASLIETRWQENVRASHCYGAQYWNHPSINATFAGPGGPVVFHDDWELAVEAAKRDGGQVLSWAGRTAPEIEQACDAAGVPLLRIEDGFLRSVGLGAGLARGAMLAVDDLGIYYDPARKSRLEVLLETYDLSAGEMARGRALIDVIVQARVSKYNFGKAKPTRFDTDQRIILVPGQVADDAAIRKSRSETIDCANTPNVNLDLLRLARERNPDAYIVFKPHPDVETGLRKGKLLPAETAGLANHVAAHANIVDLVDACDAVETFSSLAGYEALLRGKTVTVHGLPFYAGWGLTEDLTSVPERTRARTLEELVYLALVVYARTIDPVSLVHCSPEFLVKRLSEQRADRRHLFMTAVRRHMSWLGRKLGI